MAKTDHAIAPGGIICQVSEDAQGATWIVDLRHFLGPKGALATLPAPALRLAEYWTQIVAQGSNFEEPITLRCRRRPQRRPCAGVLEM